MAQGMVSQMPLGNRGGRRTKTEVTTMHMVGRGGGGGRGREREELDMRANAAGRERVCVWQCGDGDALQCDSEAVRRFPCGSLARFTISSVRCAEGVRVGGCAACSLPFRPSRLSAGITVQSSNQMGGEGRHARKQRFSFELNHTSVGKAEDSQKDEAAEKERETAIPVQFPF